MKMQMELLWSLVGQSWQALWKGAPPMRAPGECLYLVYMRK